VNSLHLPLILLLRFGSFELSRCFPTTHPLLSSLHCKLASAFSPPCQEKGGSLGEAHCTTMPSLGMKNLPPPSWLSLLLAPPTPGIIARGCWSLHRHPLTPSMEIAQLKRKHHCRESTLFFSLILFPPPPENVGTPVGEAKMSLYSSTIPVHLLLLQREAMCRGHGCRRDLLLTMSMDHKEDKLLGL
jgi:hypothetical protein